MSIAELVRTIITGCVLLGFLIIFWQEARLIWKGQLPPQNEARTYVWTAVSVVIGSVTALLLGVDFPKEARLLLISPPEYWRGVYAVFYSLAGLAAVVTWFSRTEWTSTLMKNLATTFLGIATPAVSSWLLPQVT